MTNLEDRLRVLDALYIPTRYPDSPRCKAKTPSAMPMRSLTQSVLRWPQPEQVLHDVRTWVDQQRRLRPSLRRVGLFGSYGRGTASVGSDLDLLLAAGASAAQL